MNDIYSVSYENSYQFSTDNLEAVKDFMIGKFASKLKIKKNGVECPEKFFNTTLAEKIIKDLKYFQHPNMFLNTMHLESELFEI